MILRGEDDKVSPQKPSADERDALKSYFYLMSRLYRMCHSADGTVAGRLIIQLRTACGECAKEFQQLLAKYPPQTFSRQIASLWYVPTPVRDRVVTPLLIPFLLLRE